MVKGADAEICIGKHCVGFYKKQKTQIIWLWAILIALVIIVLVLLIIYLAPDRFSVSPKKKKESKNVLAKEQGRGSNRKPHDEEIDKPNENLKRSFNDVSNDMGSKNKNSLYDVTSKHGIDKTDKNYECKSSFNKPDKSNPDCMYSEIANKKSKNQSTGTFAVDDVKNKDNFHPSISGENEKPKSEVEPSFLKGEKKNTQSPKVSMVTSTSVDQERRSKTGKYEYVEEDDMAQPADKGDDNEKANTSENVIEVQIKDKEAKRGNEDYKDFQKELKDRLQDNCDKEPSKRLTPFDGYRKKSKTGSIVED